MSWAGLGWAEWAWLYGTLQRLNPYSLEINNMAQEDCIASVIADIDSPNAPLYREVVERYNVTREALRRRHQDIQVSDKVSTGRHHKLLSEPEKRLSWRRSSTLPFVEHLLPPKSYITWPPRSVEGR